MEGRGGVDGMGGVPGTKEEDEFDDDGESMVRKEEWCCVLFVLLKVAEFSISL